MLEAGFDCRQKLSLCPRQTPHAQTETDPRGITVPTIRNAGPLVILNSQIIAALREAIDTLAQQNGLRALVLRADTDKAFVGGADIKEMATLNEARGVQFISGLRDLCEAVRQFPQPVIARIPGWCLGGGLEFAASCDFRIASSAARFAMPEVKVGIPS